MPTASETTDTSLYDSMLCMTAVSLEMSDEPKIIHFVSRLDGFEINLLEVFKNVIEVLQAFFKV